MRKRTWDRVFRCVSDGVVRTSKCPSSVVEGQGLSCVLQGRRQIKCNREYQLARVKAKGGKPPFPAHQLRSWRVAAVALHLPLGPSPLRLPLTPHAGRERPLLGGRHSGKSQGVG
jgi:hypothetical protein